MGRNWWPQRLALANRLEVPGYRCLHGAGKGVGSSTPITPPSLKSMAAEALSDRPSDPNRRYRALVLSCHARESESRPDLQRRVKRAGIYCHRPGRSLELRQAHFDVPSLRTAIAKGDGDRADAFRLSAVIVSGVLPPGAETVWCRWMIVSVSLTAGFRGTPSSGHSPGVWRGNQPRRSPLVWESPRSRVRFRRLQWSRIRRSLLRLETRSASPCSSS